MDGLRVIKACAFLAVAGAFLLSLSCSDNGRGEPEILIFAAASLSPALAEMKESYESLIGARVVVSAGGSKFPVRW